MSEEILGSESIEGDVSGLGSVEAPISEAPTEQVENTPIDSSVEQPVEKTLPQSAVQAIAAREKRRGEQAGYERALQEFNARQAQATQPGQQTGSSERPIEQLVQQEIVKMQNLKEGHAIADRLEEVVREAQFSDPEFGDSWERLNLGGHPTTLKLALELDKLDKSTQAPIIKELAKKSDKFLKIIQLYGLGNDSMAVDELKALSKSIQANQQAASQKQAPPPIQQLKPGTLGKSDGELSISDLRRKMKQKYS
jgi:hypothetical protein